MPEPRHEDGDSEAKVAAIAATLERLVETLVVARVLVQSGAAIDLDGLDRDIADLCADTVALPRAEGRDMATPLADLLTEIEQLERAMENRSRMP